MEAKKHAQTSDSAVARINGSQCLPCGMERDTLTLGDGMGQVIRRFASQNQGLEYEGREDLLQGYVRVHATLLVCDGNVSSGSSPST